MGNAVEKRNFDRASKFTPGERKTGYFNGKSLLRGKEYPLMMNINHERNLKQHAKFINGPPHRAKQR